MFEKKLIWLPRLAVEQANPHGIAKTSYFSRLYCIIIER